LVRGGREKQLLLLAMSLTFEPISKYASVLPKNARGDTLKLAVTCLQGSYSVDKVIVG